MNVLDLGNGNITDVAHVFRGEDYNNAEKLVCDVTHEDDDVLAIRFGEAGKAITINISADRIRQLLKHVDSQSE